MIYDKQVRTYNVKVGRLVVLGFNVTLTAKFISWRSATHMCLFFPKPPTTFLTCFCRGERQKFTGKKSCLNQGSNSQPPGHESDTLTTEVPQQQCNGLTISGTNCFWDELRKVTKVGVSVRQ